MPRIDCNQLTKMWIAATKRLAHAFVFASDPYVAAAGVSNNYDLLMAHRQGDNLHVSTDEHLSGLPADEVIRRAYEAAASTGMYPGLQHASAIGDGDAQPQLGFAVNCVCTKTVW